MTTLTAAVHPATRSRGRRFLALVRAETTILLRNKTAVFIAVALPLLMAVAFSGLALDRQLLGMTLGIILLATALLFVVYYTLVTSLVGRREQLVLKRLLSGEPTPWEILLAPAVPLWALLVVQAGVGIGGGLLLGAPLAHPWALVLAVVGGTSAWTALAVWSATWTRTVESAQLTTMPLLMISILLSGFSLPLSLLPDPVERLAHWLPMTPVVDLLTFAHTGLTPAGTTADGVGAALLAGGGMLLPLALWTLSSGWTRRAAP